MASFLRPCIHDGAMVRFMSVHEIPEEVVCDPCAERIADNKASAKRAADAAKARERRAARAKEKSEPKGSDSVRGVRRGATTRG